MAGSFIARCLSRVSALVPLPDADPEARATIRRTKPYTLTSPERIFSVIQAVRYIVRAGVSGEIVECGVWRGGSMMAAALTLVQMGRLDVSLRLFDTYEGMSAPTSADVDIAGRPASRRFARMRRGQSSKWCAASLEDVRANMAGTGYDMDHVHLVKGRVEETIPRHAPEAIALLRLDTDWYESTRHELAHLYPRLSAGGVLIIDDYGHWKGSRKATDEFFASTGIAMLLNRVDYTGRVGVKLTCSSRLRP